MKPALFRLLENPLVLNGVGTASGQEAPTSLFPAHSLRRPTERNQSSVVYDVSALPNALKGTRQSFCIMCTLPLEAQASSVAPGSSSATGLRADRQGQQQHLGGTSTSAHGHVSAATASGTVSSVHSRRLETLKKVMAGIDSSGNAYSQRHSSRSSASSGLNPAAQSQMHGLGLQGLAPGDHMSQQQQQMQQHRHYFGPHANRLSHYGVGAAASSSSKAAGDAHRHLRRMHGPALASERGAMSAAARKKPSTSNYKPIADPETPVLSIDEITHYPARDKLPSASTKAWLTVWLIGGELEMVGYNVSELLWEAVCDQIRQRLERESRRKQLLGMFAAHMCGIFPGFEQQPLPKGIASTWLDRDVTRDLINKFALLKQVEYDDQIHYFNIERILSPDYMRLLSLREDSDELARLVANPPVSGMTLNDTKTELALRQLQPEHLRWARKLTFVDYTQPYVDTNHPDTLFRVGTRFLRSYQSRIGQVLRYDELMKIAERWRQLIAMNGLHSALNNTSRIVMLDLQTSDTQPSSVGEGRLASRHASNPSIRTRTEQSIQAPPRGDSHDGATSASSPAATTKAGGKMPANAKLGAAGPETTSKPADESEMSLEDIQMIMESARLLHFVCAPLPITGSIKPAGTDARAFTRLFRVISAFLQNLADSYVDYLCSTGYIVARRFEKQLSWRESLQSLGYPPDKVAQFTNAVLGQPRPFFGHQNSTAEATLPSIQISSAYLFGSTERTNLVTDIEVSPEMISIRMHALSRFTSEWRSAVPGYLRSSVNPQSIKKFTFDISRYKKLLHIKSFVYDFQLRYVANLLKPVGGIQPRSADESQAPNHDNCRDHAIYSSDSDSDSQSEGSSNGNSSGDSANDDDGQIWVSGEHEDAQDDDADARPAGPRGGQKTVAQALHVHVDLTVFLADLSEQRYFSTRYSSRRLVRARFPTMYREMYEYFLAHSKRYQFYTDGCRPPMGENYTSAPSPSSRSVPVVDLCSEKASHSGCYRLYEGVLPDTMQTQFASMFGNSEPQSVVGSYPWAPVTTDASPMQKHELAGIVGRSAGANQGSTAGRASKAQIASSAPETLHKSPGSRNGSLETVQKPRVNPLAFNNRGRGAHLYSGADGPAMHAPSVGGGNANDGSGAYARESRQLAMSYAPGTHLADAFKSRIGQNLRREPPPSVHRSHTPRNHSPPRANVLQAPGVTRSDQFNHTGALNISLASSPRIASSLGSHVSRVATAAYDQSDRPASAIADELSAADRSLDFAISEYSANRIHLTSNGSFVRVSLMALTPDCDTCRVENSKEERRSRERQRNLALHTQEQQQAFENAAEEIHARPGTRKKHKEHHRRHRKRHGQKKKDGSPRIIDDINELFGRSKSKSGFSNATYDRASPTYRSVPMANAADTMSLNGRSKDQSPLQRWMASLASDIVTDPHSDGLSGNISSLGAASATCSGGSCDTAQLSYYLVIDMDPQTTHALNNLKSEDARSRNGSLGPVLDSADNNGEDGGTKGINALGIRPCNGCQVRTQCAGRPKVCGLHKVLDAVQVDMRDWENKGDVWANEPTMVMESSAIDPDEYDKEDPDVLAWIRKTARRLIRHTVVDYHRDFNWYRTYQHLRMADLPSGLAPADVSGLVGFVERQGWVDISTIDNAAAQLVNLGISGQRVVEALQLRLRRLYLEPALLMTSLLAGQTGIATKPDNVPLLASEEDGVYPADAGHRRQTMAGPTTTANQQLPVGNIRHNALSSPGLNAFVGEIPPSLDVAPIGLSRYPSANPSADIFASDEAAAATAANVQPGLRDPLCPVAVIDVHGRVLADRSSTNIYDLLRLLSPLSTRPSRRILLDPAFQKMLSRYIRLDIDASPWLCGRHRQTYTLAGFDWHLEDNQGLTPNAAGALGCDAGPGAAIPRGFTASAVFASEDGIAKSANRRVQQVQEIDIGASTYINTRHRGQRRRTGNSAISLGMMEPVSNSLSVGQKLPTSVGVSDSTPSNHNVPYVSGHKRLESHSGTGSSVAAPIGTTASIATNVVSPRRTTTVSSESPIAATFDDRFSRPSVEVMPGSLLIVDPSDTQHAARMLVLNPFAYHSVIELMFTRSIDGGEVKLSQIRSVSRDRQRDGLYEYERKHINMVLSTISAVIWDIMTESSG